MAAPRQDTIRQQIGSKFGWPGCVVPTDLLAKELLAHADQAKRDDIDERVQDGQGWKGNVCARAAFITGAKEPALIRRLYDVLSGRSVALNVNYADAFLLAVGVGLDEDTNIPTLPGCKSAALEMVNAYGEVVEPSLTLAERKELSGKLLRFSAGFLYAMEVMDERMVDKQEVAA